MKIEWAPLRVPLERRLQILVTAFFTSMLLILLSTSFFLVAGSLVGRLIFKINIGWLKIITFLIDLWRPPSAQLNGDLLGLRLCASQGNPICGRWQRVSVKSKKNSLNMIYPISQLDDNPY